MMKTSRLLSALFMFGVSSMPAFAVKHVDGLDAVWGNWGGEECVSEDNFPVSAYIQGNGDKDNDVKAFNGSCRKGYGRKLMVAMEITDKGAMFCPVFVYGLADGWHSSTWTRYGRYGDNTNCYWLCLPGWTGKNCSQSSEKGTVTTMIDPRELSLDVYKGKYDGKASTEAESSVAAFKGEITSKCYGNKSKAESDLILTVTGFLPSGHGAWVQQTAVTAYRYFGWGWNGLSCNCSSKKRCEKHRLKMSVNVVDSAGEGMGYKGTLVCAIGYTPNAAGNDCEKIQGAVFSSEDCKKVAPDFDESQHEIVSFMLETVNTKPVCEFKCKNAGYGFKSSLDYTCVECPQANRQGLSANGVCLTCDKKFIYDPDTSSCVEAQLMKESDLLYGIGKTASKTSVPCWMADDLENYTKCIYSEPWDEGKKAAESGTSKTTDDSK